MADEPDSLVLAGMRRLDGRLDKIDERLAEVIERRLDLVDAPAS